GITGLSDLPGGEIDAVGANHPIARGRDPHMGGGDLARITRPGTAVPGGDAPDSQHCQHPTKLHLHSSSPVKNGFKASTFGISIHLGGTGRSPRSLVTQALNPNAENLPDSLLMLNLKP